MSRRYAEVIGDPISHSKSPLIHNFWLEKLGIDAEYRACHVKPSELQDYFTRRHSDTAWRGCNVTIPHKLRAMQLAGVPDQQARATGAANTVFRAHGLLASTNTDIAGILAALPPALMAPGAAVCILGTGGAARAAIQAAKQREVDDVLLLGRNKEAAQALLFGLPGRAAPLDSADIRNVDVIINATSLGMAGKDPMPPVILDHVRQAGGDTVVFDMVYSPLATELLLAAREHGLSTVDGLEMLVGQAASAFEKFFGQPPPRQFDAELRGLLTS